MKVLVICGIRYDNTKDSVSFWALITLLTFCAFYHLATIVVIYLAFTMILANDNIATLPFVQLLES